MILLYQLAVWPTGFGIRVVTPRGHNLAKAEVCALKGLPIFQSIVLKFLVFSSLFSRFR